MNILVTGCAGFIGSNLCETLLKENHSVIGIDNFDTYYPKENKQDNMKNIIIDSNFKFYELDILNDVMLDEIFKENNIDVVIHLAGKAGVRNSSLYPLDYIKTNIYGTINILECMKKYDIKKMIFASSSSVYGNCKSKKFSEEEKGLKQLSIYALSKKTAEEFIEFYSRTYNFQAICLRFFTVYGNRQRPDLAISKFANQIKNNKPITIYGDGSTYRDYTHIKDIIQGIIASIEYDKTQYEIINLGSGKPIKLTKLISLLEKYLNKDANIQQTEIPKEDVFKTYADISKAKKLLKYNPQINFEDGIKEYLDNL